MKKRPIRLLLLSGILLLCMAGMIVQLLSILRKNQVIEISGRQGHYHLHIPLTEGTIYDRNFFPLNHPNDVIIAVVNPTPETMAPIFAKLTDREAVSAQIQHNTPFYCYLNEEAEQNQNLVVLHGARKADGALLAQHLLGYRQNGTAMSGLELAFSDWLSYCDSSADVTFSVSGSGEVLAGAGRSLIMNGQKGGGVVTTIDKDIQHITEKALQQATPNAGAAIVMQIETGEIVSCASTPVYDPDHLADAMKMDSAPFVNRAFSAYSVGSVFKIVTAAAALEHQIPVKFMYECEGAVSVYGQRFRCHNLNGHGVMDMQQAMIQSCNPYFITLSNRMTPEIMYHTASALGFGKGTELAQGLISAGGYLQSVEDLQIEAEKANMSFGQGKLLATPLQVCAMTACIANDGIYSEPILVRGLTMEKDILLTETEFVQHRAVSSETAAKVRRMMVSAIEKSKNTKGKPENTRAAGKTSTAQTGKTDENGNELCHAWMTGFFPVNHPQYAVTVFIENGGSGNEAAAPIFRKIIEDITSAQL